MLRHLLRTATAAALGLGALIGCTPLDQVRTLPLSVPAPSKNGVVLDVFFVRFPLADEGLNVAAWKEIDELRFPAATRRRWESNGLRAGIISGPLPAQVEELLELAEKPSDAPTAPQQVDVERPAARQRQLRVRGGRRANVIVMGEGKPLADLSVLLRNDSGQVTGRTYKNVSGLFAARAVPQGDGGVQLELTPELEHGAPEKRYTAADGMFRVEFGPPHEVLEQLRIRADLAPGQILAVTALPDRIGSIGYQLFTETEGDATQQKLVLIRLAHSEFDERFSDESPQTEGDDELKLLDLNVDVHE